MNHRLRHLVPVLILGVCATLLPTHGPTVIADDASGRSSRAFADSGQAKAASIVVSTAAQLVAAVSRAKPGVQIVVQPGEYVISAELLIRARSSEVAPLVIKASEPGAAVLKGTDTFRLRNAKWVTIEGFVFSHQWAPRKKWLRLDDCENVRITRCRFSADESAATEKDKYHSVGIEHSSHVRVDHCEFGPRTTRSTGDYISTHVGSRDVWIDHNYFRHRANIGQNGGESVMLHGAGVWSHYALVEHNLFERCNGEGEMIGLKSSRNTVRGNTLVNCEGAISIRDGSYNKVYGNIILNLLPPRDGAARRMGGVRIFGRHNMVVNNYMYRLAMPLEACWGDADPPHKDDGRPDPSRNLGYIASYDNLIAHNTLVQCECLLQLTKKGISAQDAFAWIAKVGGQVQANLATYRAHTFGGYITPHLAPRDWCFLNNVLFNTRSFMPTRVFREAQPPYKEESFRHAGNVCYTADKAFDFGPGRQFSQSQWRIVDPKLAAKGEGLFEPEAGSPLKGAARHDDSALEKWLGDADTKAVLQQCTDLGANIPVRPLNPIDVGIHAP